MRLLGQPKTSTNSIRCPGEIPPDPTHSPSVRRTRGCDFPPVAAAGPNGGSSRGLAGTVAKGWPRRRHVWPTLRPGAGLATEATNDHTPRVGVVVAWIPAGILQVGFRPESPRVHFTSRDLARTGPELKLAKDRQHHTAH